MEEKWFAFMAFLSILENVVKAQVIQEDYDRFTINVLADKLTSRERELIDTRMKSQLGEVEVVINEVADIPVGPNGKFKAVISKVAKKT